MINWHSLIDELLEQGIHSGIEIKANHKVIDLLVEQDIYNGIIVNDGIKNLKNSF